MKFQRNYQALIQGASGTLHQVSFPLTLRFFCQNDNTSTLGRGTFQFYNLAKDVRSDIYSDIYHHTLYRKFVLSAGYSEEGSLAVIHAGNILQAYSYRAGPDWITEVKTLDGDFAINNSSASFTLPGGQSAGYNYSQMINKLCQTFLPTVKIGKIGNIGTAVSYNPRGFSVAGNPWERLTRLSRSQGNHTFIFQEKVYVLSQNETIADNGAATEISADTGMIGSPRMMLAQVVAEEAFEPRIRPFQSIKLKTLSRMSGDYTVLRVCHRGTISGAVCEDLTTEVTMFNPDAYKQTQAAA